MKNLIILLFLFLGHYHAKAQETSNAFNMEGRMYLYWGWNKSAYTASNFTFTGDHYNFNLSNVKATDRQTAFSWNGYFNPKLITIPQYNFRMGYFIKPSLDISIAIDHMKYVMIGDQTVAIEGRIDSSNTNHNGNYVNGDTKQLSADFLTFEHTDGLNYVHASIRKHMNLKRIGKFSLNGFIGGSGGVMLPKTNSQLLNMERHDAVHLAGWGIASVSGLQIQFNQCLFVQGELKGGYIYMGDVRTTKSSADKMKHSFFYGEWMMVLGGSFPLRKASKNTAK